MVSSVSTALLGTLRKRQFFDENSALWRKWKHYIAVFVKESHRRKLTTVFWNFAVLEKIIYENSLINNNFKNVLRNIQ